LDIGHLQSPRYRGPLPPRKRGGRIDAKDTSHRLLQTDYLERAPNRIGDLPVQTSHASPGRCAADQRAFQRRLPADLRGIPGGPKPVEISLVPERV